MVKENNKKLNKDNWKYLALLACFSLGITIGSLLHLLLITQPHKTQIICHTKRICHAVPVSTEAN